MQLLLRLKKDVLELYVRMHITDPPHCFIIDTRGGNVHEQFQTRPAKNLRFCVRIEQPKQPEQQQPVQYNRRVYIWALFVSTGQIRRQGAKGKDEHGGHYDWKVLEG